MSSSILEDPEHVFQFYAFLSWLSPISDDLLTTMSKIDTERNLKTTICQIRKALRDQCGCLLAWLESCECADALKDACLVDDLDTAISVVWNTRAVRRRCLFLVADLVVSTLHLTKCMERTAAYVQQYLSVSELLDLKTH